MKSIVLTGITGTVAQVMKEQLEDRYEVSGVSVARMDEVMASGQADSWPDLLEAFKTRVFEQMCQALQGKTAVAHLGWNTRDENWKGGLDPLNIVITDCVYRAAIEQRVPRIYMASSVHSYDYNPYIEQDAEPIEPFPDTRTHAFGQPPTSLYGVSKRWMEKAGQFYAERAHEGQKILVVRLGAVHREAQPYRQGARLWDSHADCAGLLAAFVECDDDAPRFWIEFGVSPNTGGDYPRPLFATTNPYGFRPTGNSWTDGA